MFDLLSRAERRATKAVAVFERAKNDLRTANDHLETVKARAAASVEKVRARAEAEAARIVQDAERAAGYHTARHTRAEAAQATNSRVLSKIESLLS